MIEKGMTKLEIEKLLATQGEFIQIDYLKRFLTQGIPLDMKKFAFLKLAGIYERKKLFGDAGNSLSNVALLSLNMEDKIKHTIKAAEMFIKGNLFDKSDEELRKVFMGVDLAKRQEIQNSILSLYKGVAEQYEKDGKRNNAVQIYERMFNMNLNQAEKIDVQDKLINLYQQLGRVKDLERMKLIG